MTPTLQNALSLLKENVKSQSLQRHCLSVGFAMKEYAKHLNLSPQEQEKYEIAGILHDFDFEKYPNLEQHPFEGVKILRSLNYSEDIVEAILGHGDHTKVPRVSIMAKTLFAVDELSGLIIALAHARPTNLSGMTPKSIKKALKKPGFAKAINRDDIQKGITELGVDKDEHFSICIKALQNHAKELEF